MRADAGNDGGFVVLDALMAALLLALAGTVIVAIATTTIVQRDAELDRSVALVMSQSLMRQYLLLSPVARRSIEAGDELYSYAFQTEPTADAKAVQEVSLIAKPKAETQRSERLSFLAPASSLEGGR